MALAFPLTLLNLASKGEGLDERELTTARQLEELLRACGVDGRVVRFHHGPVLTTFEFEPKAGVPCSTVLGLADELRFKMETGALLIDFIPDKSIVGIQIPNVNPEVIGLRELLESAAYRHSTSTLTMAIGKTVHGEPFVIDLATMPHLLIAGSAQSGKSVGLRAMLTSILYRATPEDVRLILIDTGRVSLGIYEDIPHLLTPVVVDPRKAVNALRWAVREMEARYKKLAAEGVRNIEQYNRNIRLADANGTPAPNGMDLKRLPFILVIVDELADLMMIGRNQVEQSIESLAQMARAVGIHLILATGRQSVTVLTGLIKANVPSRISFQMSSTINSRAILDSTGAEQLLGKGDMLFLPPTLVRGIRLHGAYVSEEEGVRVAGFLREQGKPVFDESITSQGEQNASCAADSEENDLYLEAAWIVISTGHPSISYLQRRLRIGFSRAARLIDRMKAEGLV